MEVKVMLASDLGEDVRKKMSDIFADAFYQWIKYFSDDKEKLSKAFSHMFVLEKFYVAVVNGEIGGISACTNGKVSSVILKTSELRKHLGFIKGSIAGIVLKKEFENHPYPFELAPNCGSVEFVATHEKYRGNGIATAIINHIIKVNSYSEFVLEAADTNTPAVRLYEKQGFKEFTRIAHKQSKQSGINYLVYMKYKRNRE